MVRHTLKIAGNTARFLKCVWTFETLCTKRLNVFFFIFLNMLKRVYQNHLPAESDNNILYDLNILMDGDKVQAKT